MNDPLRDLSKNDLVREVQRLRHLLDQQMSAAPGIGDEVIVEGIVSITTGLPVVTMRAGEAAWQFTPAQAREHGYATIERAIEAERDAATIAFLRGADFDEQAAGSFLQSVRQHRQQWTADFRDAGAT
jgi:hypothetical protein